MQICYAVCYSQTGMFDILIHVVTVINWIIRTIMGQVVYVAEAM